MCASHSRPTPCLELDETFPGRPASGPRDRGRSSRAADFSTCPKGEGPSLVMPEIDTAAVKASHHVTRSQFVDPLEWVDGAEETSPGLDM